ncbi:hypothetical protein CR513_51550, partial [Mucuna pruriens]
MDSGSGMSWADQWDNNPDPLPEPEKDKKKSKDGSSKSKFGKTVMSFKWVKELRKKTTKGKEKIKVERQENKYRGEFKLLDRNRIKNK